MGRQQTNVGAMQWMPLPNYKPGGQPIFPQPMDYRLGRDDQAPGPYMQNLGSGLPTFRLRGAAPAPDVSPYPEQGQSYQRQPSGMLPSQPPIPQEPAGWQPWQRMAQPPAYPLIGMGFHPQSYHMGGNVGPAESVPGMGDAQPWEQHVGIGSPYTRNPRGMQGVQGSPAQVQQQAGFSASEFPQAPLMAAPRTYYPEITDAAQPFLQQGNIPYGTPARTDSPYAGNADARFNPDQAMQQGAADFNNSPEGQRVNQQIQLGQQNYDTLHNYLMAMQRADAAAENYRPPNPYMPTGFGIGMGGQSEAAQLRHTDYVQQQTDATKNAQGMWANTGVGSHYVAPAGAADRDAAARRYAGAPSLNPDLAAREAEYRNAMRKPIVHPTLTPEQQGNRDRYAAELQARKQNVQIGAAGGPIPSMLRQVARGEDMSPDERGVLGIGQALPDQNPAIMHNTYVGLAQAYATATDPKVREFLQGQLTNLGPQVFGPPQIGSAAQPPNPADVWQREQQNIDQWHAAGQNGEPPATSAKGITYAKKLGYNGTVKGYDAATGTVKPIGTGSSPPSTSPAAGNTANVEPPPAAGNTANVEPPPPPEVADQIKKEIGTYHALWPFSTGDPVANLPANIVQSYPRYIYSIMNNQWGPEQVDRYMQPHRHLSPIPPGFAPDPSNGRDEQRRYADAISSGEPRRKALLVGPQADAPQVTAIPKPPPAKPSLAPNPNSPAGKAAAKGDEKATTAGKIAAAKRANTPIKIKLGK